MIHGPHRRGLRLLSGVGGAEIAKAALSVPGSGGFQPKSRKTSVFLVVMCILNGLTLGAVLFIVASGLTLSFSLMRVVNLSHGAFYLCGGFTGLTVYKISGSWVLGLLAAGSLVSILALVEERFFLRWARGNDLIETLVSLSIAILISDLVLVIWTGYPRNIEIPAVLSGAVDLPGIGMPYPLFRLFTLGLAVALGLGLLLFLKKTNTGILIRAGVDNFHMVAAMGFNVKRLFTLVFVLSGFLAGMAGVIGGTSWMLQVGEDWRILTLTLIVIIIGGMGSLGGTVLGALITGVISEFSKAYVPEFSLFFLFLPVAVILSIRPQGLFGRGRV
ncbi:MAG: branched-chain amino acid ABC transporter permease [Desulfobacteraceae bacterium]|nr:MAG: branched-chain amino acid ABC transporter permease [Desulfobacteraceae bacterium]